MNNDFGRRGFQPNSSIEGDPNGKSGQAYSNSGKSCQTETFNSFEQSDPGFLSHIPHDSTSGVTISPDLLLLDLDHPSLTGTWQQDELLNTSVDTSTFTDAWGLPTWPGKPYQTQTDVNYGNQENHLIPSVNSVQGGPHYSFNLEGSSLANSLSDEWILAHQQKSSDASHQNAFESLGIMQHLEHIDERDNFDQDHPPLTNRLALPEFDFQELLHPVLHFDNTTETGMIPQHGTTTVFDLQQCEHDGPTYQSGVGQDLNPCDIPGTFVQDSLTGIPVALEMQTGNTSWKKGKTPARNTSTEVPSEEEWEAKKHIIERIWLKEQHTMPELIKEMAIVHLLDVRYRRQPRR